MTDPAVSPFDLIREALDPDGHLAATLDYCRDRGYEPPPALRPIAALDQLQRDHEALKLEIEQLKQSIEWHRDNAFDGAQVARVIDQRDAAVREAETLLHDLIGGRVPLRPQRGHQSCQCAMATGSCCSDRGEDGQSS